MTWNAGSDHPWPTEPFRITAGELLLVSHGDHAFGVLRLERNIVYPGLSDAASAPMRITLKAIQETRLELSPEQPCQQTRRSCETRDLVSSSASTRLPLPLS